jgi:magnesium transporter
MGRHSKSRKNKVGLSPGSIIHIGEQKTSNIILQHYEYDMDDLVVRDLKNISECFPYISKSSVSWVNIDGLHDVDVIETLGKNLNLHPLTLEDIANTNQRPKIEDYGEYLFCAIKMLTCDDPKHELEIENVSIILGPTYIITYQERPGDVFDPVRERLKNKNGRIRKMKADYLAYALIDTIVDNYFVVLEKLGERIEELEDELVEKPSQNSLQEIYHLKREFIYIRKAVWPLREIMSFFQKSDSPLIVDTTKRYIHDLYDHTAQIIDTCETSRDMLSSMLETYLSSISNKMNDVMKILTIFTTIFIPITFISSMYGMNFKNIPETEYQWGYFVVWGVNILIAIFMLAFFRRKRWI